jgi:hypothetical protein
MVLKLRCRLVAIRGAVHISMTMYVSRCMMVQIPVFEYGLAKSFRLLSTVVGHWFYAIRKSQRIERERLHDSHISVGQVID